MEQFAGGITLNIPEGAFPLSTDSMVLSQFVRWSKDAQILDLGSGCGTLSMLLCSRSDSCCVTGIEIDSRSHLAALENIERNQLQTRCKSICGDLRNISEILPAGKFSVCISNPPYFSGGPKSENLGFARQDDSCTPSQLFHAASVMLKYGGDFFLVHKPEKLAQLIACGAAENLEAKQLRLVRHRQGNPIGLILLQFRKGGKPGLILEEKSLLDSAGKPTEYYESIYHT